METLKSGISAIGTARSVMSMRCIADHGFRYCAEVNDHGEMERGASRLDRWCRVIWVLMWTIFLLFLFIIL